MALSSRKRNANIKDSAKPKKVKGQFILFVGDEGAILSYIENGVVTRRLYSPQPDHKATETLTALLTEYDTPPIYMLVDMVDQSYVRHTLPPVTPLGVNKIIQRRLNRDFAADDIKGYISLGREKSGRKDWNFLLIALAMNEKLAGWCDLIYNLPNRFSGIYLAPAEAEYLIQQLDKSLNKDNQSQGSKKKKFSLKKTPDVPIEGDAESAPSSTWNILVMHNKTGGFRQIVLKNSKLVFTRMAQPTDDDNPTIIAGNIEQEVKNTIEYLKRLSFNNNSQLNITIILGEEIKAHISPETFYGSSTNIITPYEAAEMLGVQKSVLSGDRYADVLLSSAFAKTKKKKLKLSTESITKTENLYKAILGVKSLTALVVIGLLGASAFSAYEMLSLQSEIGDTEKKAKTTLVRLNEFEEKAATFEEDPFKVDSLIKIHDAISLDAPDYMESIKRLVPLIDNSLTLRSFSWETEGVQAANKSGNQNNRSIANNIDNTEQQSNLSIQFEAIAQTTKREEFLSQWEKKAIALKEVFSNYTIEHKDIPGFEKNQDELQINFEERSRDTIEAGQRVIIPVTITGPQNDNTGQGS